MKPYKVKDLLELCKLEVEKGNGDKVILISNDDEGNGYHYLWYSFCEVEDVEAEEYIDEKIAKKEDTIILG